MTSVPTAPEIGFALETPDHDKAVAPPQLVANNHIRTPSLSDVNVAASSALQATGHNESSASGTGHVSNEGLTPGRASPSDGLGSEPDPEIEMELRKLDEDFQKNLERAKKVFDNRMDNLQRSQVEREAQHQKTLEKHQKERAEYEKRLAAEEEQQNRRLEQLQREWDKKREALALEKRKQPSSDMNGVHSSSEPNDLSVIGIPPLSGSAAHQRSSSAASSHSFSAPTMDHKQYSDVNGGVE